MKKLTPMFLALLLSIPSFGAVMLGAPGEATAQSRRHDTHRHDSRRHDGHRTRRHHRSHRTRRTTRHHYRTTRTHSHHRHHRSGVYVHFRFGHPYFYYSTRSRYHRHYGHHSVYHRTYVYPRTETVVVEPEPGFVMPEIDCPVRTDEVRVGYSQWCETARGNKHGPFRRWYDDGRVASEGEYAYDLKVGYWTDWHPNGAIRQEGEYDDGERIGTWITWDADGEELSVVEHDE